MIVSYKIEHMIKEIAEMCLIPTKNVTLKVVCCVAFILFINFDLIHASRFGIIMGDKVHVRFGPSLASGIKANLNRFDLVKVVSRSAENQEWMMIEYCSTSWEPHNITTGYLHQELIKVFESPKSITTMFHMQWEDGKYMLYFFCYVYSPSMIPLDLSRYPHRAVRHEINIDTLEILYGNKVVGKLVYPTRSDEFKYNFFASRKKVAYEDIHFYTNVDTLPYFLCLPKGISNYSKLDTPLSIDSHKLKEVLLMHAESLFIDQDVEAELLPKVKVLNFNPTNYNDDNVPDIMGSFYIREDIDHIYYLNILLASTNEGYEVVYHSFLKTYDYRQGWHLLFYGVYDFFMDGNPELIGFWYGCDAFGRIVIELRNNTWQRVFVYYGIA